MLLRLGNENSEITDPDQHRLLFDRNKHGLANFDGLEF